MASSKRDDHAFVIEDEGLELLFACSQKDRERMLLLEADIQRLAGLLGRWRRGCERTWFPHGAAHLVGTCRMDRPDWEGVTNAAGLVHGFDNLYLTSVGLFPVPVAENPTLTALAVTLKTCKQFVS